MSLPKDTRRLEWLLLSVAVLLGLLALCGCAPKPWYESGTWGPWKTTPTGQCRDYILPDGNLAGGECIVRIK